MYIYIRILKYPNVREISWSHRNYSKVSESTLGDPEVPWNMLEYPGKSWNY